MTLCEGLVKREIHGIQCGLDQQSGVLRSTGSDHGIMIQVAGEPASQLSSGLIRVCDGTH
jgi:hypothetical protein